MSDPKVFVFGSFSEDKTRSLIKQPSGLAVEPAKNKDLKVGSLSTAIGVSFGCFNLGSGQEVDKVQRSTFSKPSSISKDNRGIEGESVKQPDRFKEPHGSRPSIVCNEKKLHVKNIDNLVPKALINPKENGEMHKSSDIPLSNGKKESKSVDNHDLSSSHASGNEVGPSIHFSNSRFQNLDPASLREENVNGAIDECKEKNSLAESDVPATVFEDLLPRGLINSGNLCFLNATLQALLSCLPLVHLFQGLRRCNIPKVGYPTLAAFSEFISEFCIPSSSLKKKDVNILQSGRPFSPAVFETVLKLFTPDVPSSISSNGRQRFSPVSLPEDDRAWWARVQGTGLHYLHDATIRRPSMALLTAFVERWSPETNTFHMPWGEMTITMHDVTHILGISCSGGPVTKAVPEPNVAGIRARLDTCRKGTTYSLDGLRRSFETPSDMTDDERASTYIMFLLGSTLFVDKTQDKMPSDYLSLCVDIDRVGALSWGTAALVYLYRELGKASRYGCKQIGGCLSLLEAWIYEYFPVFRRDIDPLWTEGQPRARRWVRADTAGRDMPHLLKFRYTLDSMTVDRVCWTPYGTTPEALLPVSYFRGVIRFQDITEAYMPDRVTRQFEIQQKIPRDPISHSRDCSLMAGQKGYKKSYGTRDDIWEDWLEDGLGVFDPVRRWGPSVSASDPVTSTYMQWFLARTHVRITNPNHDALVNIPPPPRVIEARDILLPLLTDDRIPADVIDQIRRAHALLGDA